MPEDYESFFYRRIDSQIRLVQVFLVDNFKDIFQEAYDTITPVMNRLGMLDSDYYRNNYWAEPRWVYAEVSRIKDGLIFHLDRAAQFDSYVQKMSLSKNYISLQRLGRFLPPEVIIETTHGYIKGFVWFIQTLTPLIYRMEEAYDEGYIALVNSKDKIQRYYDTFAGLYDSFTQAMDLNWQTDDIDTTELPAIIEPEPEPEPIIEPVPTVRRRRDFDS